MKTVDDDTLYVTDQQDLATQSGGQDRKIPKGDNDIDKISGRTCQDMPHNQVVFVDVHNVRPQVRSPSTKAKGLVTADYQSSLEKGMDRAIALEVCCQRSTGCCDSVANKRSGPPLPHDGVPITEERHRFSESTRCCHQSSAHPLPLAALLMLPGDRMQYFSGRKSDNPGEGP